MPQCTGFAAGGEGGDQQRCCQKGDAAENHLRFTVVTGGKQGKGGSTCGNIQVQRDAVKPCEMDPVVAFPASGGLDLKGEAEDQQCGGKNIDHYRHGDKAIPRGEQCAGKQRG